MIILLWVDFIGELGDWGGVGSGDDSGFLTEYVGEPAYGAAAKSNRYFSFKYRRIMKTG